MSVLEWIIKVYKTIGFGGSVALLTGILVVFEKAFGWKFVGTKIFDWVKAFVTMPNRLKRVEGEVTYNGGSSMKDLFKVVSNTVEDIRMDIQASNSFDDQMIFYLDAHGYLRDPNMAFCNQFGYKEYDVRAHSYENKISKRDLLDVQVKIRRSSETESYFEFVCNFISSEGDEIPCIVKGVPMFRKKEFTGFKCKVSLG